MRNHDEATDCGVEEGVERPGIIAEGHASVRLAVRAQHVGVSKNSGATIHPAFINGIEADRAKPMKQSLAQREMYTFGGVDPRILTLTWRGVSMRSPKLEWACRRRPLGR